MSLVADYSSCSDDDNVSDDTDFNKLKCSYAPKKLPSATLLLSGQKLKGLEAGVFTNPYKQKEDENTAMLEHHVKMVNTNEKVEKNGKKICWNYRKGRCRFGSNCSYYHDSDIIITESNTTSKQNIPADNIQNTTNNLSSVCKSENKNKRPGLGDSIVPSKKVIKAFYSNK